MDWTMVNSSIDLSSRWASAWIPLAWKAAFLLAAAGLGAAALRQASASARHLLWTLAVVGVLVLPVLGHLLPAWEMDAFSSAPPTPMVKTLEVDRSTTPKTRSSETRFA